MENFEEEQEFLALTGIWSENPASPKEPGRLRQFLRRFKLKTIEARQWGESSSFDDKEYSAAQMYAELRDRELANAHSEICTALDSNNDEMVIIDPSTTSNKGYRVSNDLPKDRNPLLREQYRVDEFEPANCGLLESPDAVPDTRYTIKVFIDAFELERRLSVSSEPHESAADVGALEAIGDAVMRHNAMAPFSAEQ